MRDAAALNIIPHMKCPHRTMTTGSWRSSRPVMAPDKCNLCLLCWVFCPEGAIRQAPDLSIDLDYCKGCGICASECRRDAIRMVEETLNG
jgi:2-oxoacid:acceptor oxidoreductase delta subunit (pyruvate/2-ketoisovalerate family)